MDEMKARRDMSLGDAAQRAIDGQVDIWQDIDKDLWEMFKKTKVGHEGSRSRDDIHHELHAIEVVKSRYENTVNQGKKAAHELEQQRAQHEHRNST